MFSDIGSRIRDFLDSATYELNRTANVCVFKDPVSWNLETALNTDGTVNSDLSATYSFQKEDVTLKTSTNSSPSLSVRSKRLTDIDTTIKGSDPEVTFEFGRRKDKIGGLLRSKYNWEKHNCDAELSAAYRHEKFLLGAEVKVERAGKSTPVELSEYNFGVQFDRNIDQSFALTTKDKFEAFNLGGQSKIRDGLTMYGSVEWRRTNQNFAWQLGVEKQLNSTSTVAAVLRDTKVASFMFRSHFNQPNVEAKMAVNVDHQRPGSDRYSLQWKLSFC